MKLQALVLFLLLNGCAVLRGPIRESKTNAALYPHMTQVTYPLSQGALFEFVKQDLEAEHQWHLKHDELYFTGRTLDPNQTAFTVRGNVCEVPLNTGVIRERCLKVKDPNGKLVRLVKDEGPVIVEGISFDYLIHRIDGAPDQSRLEVRNKSDGTRVYYKELQVYRRYDAAAADRILNETKKTYADLAYEPWE